MNQDRRYCLLTDMGVLQISGADALTFLQGQLSNDMKSVTASESLLAGFHSPQGRVLVLFRLLLLPEPVGTSSPRIAAIMPRELIEKITVQLRRFVFRAKVTIADTSDDWQVVGGVDDAVPERFTYSLQAAEATIEAGLSLAAWSALEVAAGIPRIYAASSGEFVAQMLNLDLLNGIAWDKGCYTGQEIIARAHYRGQMKRRMQRFRVVGQTQPNPGAMHTTTDGQRVQVVRPASHADGHVEILAVAPLEPRSIDALPLPYSLPA